MHWSHKCKVLSDSIVDPQSSHADSSLLTTTAPFSYVIIIGEPLSMFIALRMDFGITIRPFVPSFAFFIPTIPILGRP